MKMTSWGCCVLDYDRSGEPAIHSNEPKWPRTDLSGSECEVGALTSEEESEREKSQTKRAPKSPLTAVLESWLLSILHCRFLSYQWFIPCVIARWCRDDSGSIRKWRGVDWRGDWWAVEGASHCCYQEPGTVGRGPQHDVPEAVHSRGRSRELLEWAFDDGNSFARMRNLLVLFQVGSKFLPCFFFCRSVRDRSRCHCDSCHWASNAVLVSLRLRRGQGSVAVSFDEQLVLFCLFGFSSIVSVNIFRFFCW